MKERIEHARPSTDEPRTGCRTSRDADLDDAVVEVLTEICGELDGEEDDAAPLIEVRSVSGERVFGEEAAGASNGMGSEVAVIQQVVELIGAPAATPVDAWGPWSPWADDDDDSRVTHPEALANAVVVADALDAVPPSPHTDAALSPDPVRGADGSPTLRPTSLTSRADGAPRATVLGGRWVATAAALVAAALAVNWLWPERAGLEIHVSDPQLVPTAEVFVDGTKVCDATPCVVRDLAAGAHFVKLVSPEAGISALVTQELVAGEVGRVTVPAEPLVARRQRLVAATRASGATLLVDGVPMGALPVELEDLSAGRHTLRFEAPGYRALERTVTLYPGERLDLGDLVLDPNPEKLRVELVPKHAFLLIGKPGGGNEERVSGPWPRTLDLAPGHYELIAFRGGYRTATMRVEVKTGGRVETVRMDLSKDDIYQD